MTENITTIINVKKDGKGPDFSGEPYKLGRMKDFYSVNRGRQIRYNVELYNGDESLEKRRYFEGALIPVLTHFQNKERSNKLPPYTRADIRLLVAREFNGKVITKNDGTSFKVGLSTKIGNRAFAKMLDRITDWMKENGIPVPCNKEYKKWRDSAPPVGVKFLESVWLPLYDPDYVDMSQPTKK